VTSKLPSVLVGKAASKSWRKSIGRAGEAGQLEVLKALHVFPAVFAGS
jgi:hypothetical protein